MLDRGDVFAGYRIEGTLGRGGMGAVYLARRSGMPRPVALKLLNSDVSADPEIRTRFEDEAEVVAHLHHPGIVAVYDSGIDDDRLWMAMQYVDGRDATVVSPRSLPPDRVLALIDTTADALDYAHNAGVLHRDVKPANILLARPTRARREAALLTDFGIARLREEPGQPTHSGTILATLAYAAPEQLRGLPLDHRSDQYSLACTLFRMLTGALPHAANNPAAMIKGHLHDPPQPVATVRPELPNTLDKVMIRALAKHPTDRYPTCTEFVDAVRQAFTGPTTAVFPSRTTHPTRERIPYPAPDQPLSYEPAPHIRPGNPRAAEDADSVEPASYPRLDDPRAAEDAGSVEPASYPRLDDPRAAEDAGSVQDPQSSDEPPTARFPVLAAYSTRPAKSPSLDEQHTPEEPSSPHEQTSIDGCFPAGPTPVEDFLFDDESPTTRISIAVELPAFAMLSEPDVEQPNIGAPPPNSTDSPPPDADSGDTDTGDPAPRADISCRSNDLEPTDFLAPDASRSAPHPGEMSAATAADLESTGFLAPDASRSAPRPAELPAATAADLAPDGSRHAPHPGEMSAATAADLESTGFLAPDASRSAPRPAELPAATAADLAPDGSRHAPRPGEMAAATAAGPESGEDEESSGHFPSVSLTDGKWALDDTDSAAQPQFGVSAHVEESDPVADSRSWDESSTTGFSSEHQAPAIVRVPPERQAPREQAAAPFPMVESHSDESLAEIRARAGGVARSVEAHLPEERPATMEPNQLAELSPDERTPAGEEWSAAADRGAPEEADRDADEVVTPLIAPPSLATDVSCEVEEPIPVDDSGFGHELVPTPIAAAACSGSADESAGSEAASVPEGVGGLRVATLPEERKPVGVRATCMEIAPNVFLAEEIPPRTPRPAHRRPMTADKARLGYILMMLAALLIVVVAIFG
ncbi:protein kinase [Nocardia sp. NPDC051832]|uniref:serine/threonine-protein kinase n=1 Tax=Nocardia sp. NPDC051832 TaxID=3155673 RepID=UPI00342FA03B